MNSAIAENVFLCELLLELVNAKRERDQHPAPLVDLGYARATIQIDFIIDKAHTFILGQHPDMRNFEGRDDFVAQSTPPRVYNPRDPQSYEGCIPIRDGK